jgi:hypothetical protein
MKKPRFKPHARPTSALSFRDGRAWAKRRIFARHISIYTIPPRYYFVATLLLICCYPAVTLFAAKKNVYQRQITYFSQLVTSSV